MTFRRSNQKPRTKKSHVMEQFFLSPVKKTRRTAKKLEVIVSLLQRRNEGRHIVLIGLFLLLFLFILTQTCSAVTLLSFELDL
jgi:hypothetical protein